MLRQRYVSLMTHIQNLKLEETYGVLLDFLHFVSGETEAKYLNGTRSQHS